MPKRMIQMAALRFFAQGAARLGRSNPEGLSVSDIMEVMNEEN